LIIILNALGRGKRARKGIDKFPQYPYGVLTVAVLLI
jgi:hypothetical protein